MPDGDSKRCNDFNKSKEQGHHSAVTAQPTIRLLHARELQQLRRHDDHVVAWQEPKEAVNLVAVDRFVRLLAAHVPDHYRHAIRYFGLLAPREKDQHHAALFNLLGERRRRRPQPLSWRESVKKCFGVDPMIDSFGQEMYWV